MSVLEVYSQNSGTLLVPHIRLANGVWSRFRGLMLTRALKEGEGLLIAPCYSVHTMFMRFSIDVIFLDSEDRVTKIAESLRPFRFAVGRGARRVLEISAGSAQALGLHVGDRLRFTDVG